MLLLHTMARMNDLMIDLQDAVRKGEHSFEDIARIYDVPQHWVDLALGEVLEQERQDYDMGDVFLNEFVEEDE
ncbi:MAG: hypothetical protein EBX69_11525 [Betaproteobacteria bacterium]|nr:hypothetical protein [Betaproteobacteria bacterium]